MTAMIAGTVLALLALAYVLYPLYAGAKPPASGHGVRVCSKCGTGVEDDAIFCSACGEPLMATS